MRTLLKGSLLFLNIWNELPFLAVILVSALSVFWLAVGALKAHLILKFEDGLSRNYLLLGHGLEDKKEILFFEFRHLDAGQIFFLMVCWIIRKANPKTSVHDLRFPAVISNTNIHVSQITSSRGRAVSSQPDLN